MDTVTLSSKGQLVLPKPVREALRLKAGNRLSVAVQGTRIILEPETAQPGAWRPLNPAGARISDDALCQPVDLRRDTHRG
jgi:AbrB family looped-hinge helix DNA binding protein